MTKEIQNIPSGYKQTEIGPIPADWELVSFDDVFRKINSKDFQIQATEYDNFGSFPVVDQGQKEIVSFSDNEDKKYTVPDGGVIVFGDHTRIVKYINYDFVVGADGTQILATKEGFNTYFYASILKNKEIPNTGYNRHFKFLKECIFVKPTFVEQSLIVSALFDIDVLINKLRLLIKKKRNIKQGAMQELLTGKRRLSRSRGEWKIKLLYEMADFEHGQGLSKADLSSEGIYKCIHYGQLFTGYKELIGEIKDTTNVACNHFYSKANDVLMPTSDVTPRGLATASCIQEDDVVLGGGILVIRLHAGYDGVFLSYFIAQNKSSILKLVKGSTVFHLYANDLANLAISFPELEEQKAIAQILTDMEIEIEKLESQLLKYQNIKQGMMQTLLTGKIRLITK